MRIRKQIIPILMLFAALLLVFPVLAIAADDTAVNPTEVTPTSPSKVSRDRINALRSNEFFYQSYGRNDPFTVLVDGDYEKASGSDLVDANSAKLVGVMWGPDDRFALVEDGDGFGYILHVGDRVQNGRVVSIRKNSITAQITLYGITNKVVLKLEKLEAK